MYDVIAIKPITIKINCFCFANVFNNKRDCTSLYKKLLLQNYLSDYDFLLFVKVIANFYNKQVSFVKYNDKKKFLYE